jgi:hypothetical protein
MKAGMARSSLGAIQLLAYPRAGLLALFRQNQQTRRRFSGLWRMLSLVSLLGAGQLWADTISSEGPPIHDATDIPSQLERGFSKPVTPETAGILPETPLANVSEMPQFLKDTDFILHLRNYYLTRNDLEGSDIETWAQGGWLGFTTGRAWDVLSFGATFYGSYKLYGPEIKDGALLLMPGQENLTVLGELYAQVNYARHLLKLGRQEYDLPFLNRQDNRMIPNTFEGYHLAAPVAENPHFQYGAGYIHKIKKRNSDTFIPMSEAAGTPAGVERGAFAGGARYTPADAFSLEVFDVYTPDILNIFYAEAVSRLKTEAGVGLKLSGQLIHQKSVGDDLLMRSADSTHALGAKAEISYRKAVLTLVLTGNSSSEDLMSPYGSYAGYNSIIINDYNRAGEHALRAGLAYDFAEVGLKGMSAFGNYAWGFNAVDSASGNDIPNQDEFDFTLDYSFQDSWLKGLSLRLRAALIDEEGGRTLEDYRFIANYTF